MNPRTLQREDKALVLVLYMAMRSALKWLRLREQGFQEDHSKQSLSGAPFLSRPNGRYLSSFV